MSIIENFVILDAHRRQSADRKKAAVIQSGIASPEMQGNNFAL